MIPDTWIEHRREDGERLGWIEIVGDACVPIDALGRPLPATTDWLDAEAALEERGIGFLADRYAWHRDGGAAVAVRITQLDGEHVFVKYDDFGDVTASAAVYELPFPAPDELRPWTGDTQDAIDSLSGENAQRAARG
ncbi:hypothetical protein F8O01_02250 [Pseudoclavibacter chungangensis]|uniref:Uncharacterized protein n=1 Tax=Pseudoclavibacter chungangensis TaxID=587635 RepID=A0A7J5C116_9MICO|nr:hypothetical protein [Pseudoclavibacter chungangensis]KAB1662302.1 hypothetical protein F8O01_02250 [Pseudoclavibacter chungangensis]NYJ65510.1 hypothetical protein [Pseudoclavibacter chungangensis]